MKKFPEMRKIGKFLNIEKSFITLGYLLINRLNIFVFAIDLN